jgi:hypothetical protein
VLPSFRPSARRKQRLDSRAVDAVLAFGERSSGQISKDHGATLEARPARE